ncbi:MAG: hypothetical protein GF315_06570 [candidate division Zixibacteria bacterium]|nr:hypothetical protein [candidate division Zixibacteria bacterium]
MIRPIIVYSVMIILSIIIIGCSDDDNPLTPQEEHFDAAGLIIYQSGATILDYFAPDYPPGTTEIDDTLFVSQGLNPHWNAKFYDEDRNVIDPPDNDNQHFGAEFADSDIAELWWHEGDEGEFEFHINGLAEGVTTVEFQALHVDHADFTTLPIPIVVDTTVLHGEPIGVKLIDEESDSLLATAYLEGSGNPTQDTLRVVGGETTDHIETIFFDEDDIEFWPGVPPHSLVVTSSDTTIAAITGQEPDEPWAFKLNGKSAGECTITVFIYYDGEIDKQFEEIPVTVN